MDTIFTTCENFADTLRRQFITEGMEARDVADIEESITNLTAEMNRNSTEGARLRSDFLDVTVTLTSYADQARDAVKLGASVLDKVRDDDWRSKIDLETLDVSSIVTCPIVQLYGGFHTGIAKITTALRESGEDIPAGWDKAFSGCSYDDARGCCGAASPMSVLTLAWKEYLASSVPPVSDPLLDLINRSE